MRKMFFYCQSLISLNLSDFNTDNVIDMRNMFRKCKALTSLDLSNFNTQKVTNNRYTFYGCNPSLINCLKKIY